MVVEKPSAEAMKLAGPHSQSCPNYSNKDWACRCSKRKRALTIDDLIRSRIADIQEKTLEAFRRYKASEGCSCCRNCEEHSIADNDLARIFGIPRYDDNSGNDWEASRNPDRPVMTSKETR